VTAIVGYSGLHRRNKRVEGNGPRDRVVEPLLERIGLSEFGDAQTRLGWRFISTDPTDHYGPHYGPQLSGCIANMTHPLCDSSPQNSAESLGNEHPMFASCLYILFVYIDTSIPG
jgi:hypothetical protein